MCGRSAVIRPVNLILRGGPDKGVALRRARRALGCETVIYVGNDDTDEDAFASAPHGRLLAIRVGPAKVSHARYRLKTQADINSFLQTLLTLRSRQPAPEVRQGGQRPQERA